MKRMLVVLLGLAACCTILAFGQDQSMMKDDPAKQLKMDQNAQGMMNRPGMMKDGVMMKGGKMWMMKNGKSTEMDKEMTLANGWIVAPSGEVTMGEGKKMQMKNGMMVDMKGKMMKTGKTMQKDEKMMQGGAKQMMEEKKDTMQSMRPN